MMDVPLNHKRFVEKCLKPRSIVLFLSVLLAREANGTSLDIALAFARYVGAIFTSEEVARVMPDINGPLDNIAEALRLSPLAINAANQFTHKISSTLLSAVVKLIVFGYLIPLAVLILVTVATCWYIREEIRNLYPMLVPFPVAKKACEEYLARMDKKLIQELMKKQEEELAKDTAAGGGSGSRSQSMGIAGPSNGSLMGPP